MKKCQNTHCLLYEKGCTVANPASSKESIGSASPWDISIPQNEILGFDETKCVVCTSAVGEIKLDNLRIKQFPLMSANTCDWKKVRHLPNGSRTWHKAVDQLKGTEVYGDPTDVSAEWSI